MERFKQYGLEGGNFNIDPPMKESGVPMQTLQEEAMSQEYAMSAAQAQHEEELETGTALESLLVTLESLKDSKNLNRETAYLIETIISDKLKNIGLENIHVSTESFTGNADDYLQVSIETLKETLHRIKEGEIRYWKSFLDNTTSIFKTYEAIAITHSNRAIKLQKEIDNKPQEWHAANHQLTTVGLKHYFFTQDGLADRPLTVLPGDYAFNSYILKNYHAAMSAEIDKAANIISSGDYKNIESFNRTVGSKLLALKNPSSFFDPKYLKGLPFLCACGYVAYKDTLVTTKSADKTIIALAEKASDAHITPNPAGVNFHNGKVVLSPYYPIGMAVVIGKLMGASKKIMSTAGAAIFGAGKAIQVVVDGILSQSTYVTTAEVQEVLNFSKRYSKNILDVRQTRHDAKNRLDTAMNSIIVDDLDPAVAEGVKVSFKLLSSYLKNLYIPFNYELKRAARLAKGCEYLVASALKTQDEEVEDLLGRATGRAVMKTAGVVGSALGAGINATADYINEKTL